MARKPAVSHQICSVLAEKHLLSASQILEELKLKFQPYNKTSVYRALDTLLAENKVCRHLLTGDDVQYELRLDHHDHSVCTNCHKVSAIECSEHNHPEVPGFTVNHHHATVYGLCEGCTPHVTKTR